MTDPFLMEFIEEENVEDIDVVDPSYTNPLLPTGAKFPITGHQRTDAAIRSSLMGLDILIENTWDGKPIDHDPISLHLEWLFEKIPGRPHKRAVKVYLQSPLFDDPDPPDVPEGICPGLWEYEVVELFFANNRGHYLEVEVGPHGHWLCLMHDGYRKAFNKGEDLELSVQNTWEGNIWHCTFEIPLAYLPGGVSKLNAYAIHGSGEDRVYEAWSPPTDGTLTEPDFHRLEFFRNFDLRRIVPACYATELAFQDFKYDNFWEGR